MTDHFCLDTLITHLLGISDSYMEEKYTDLTRFFSSRL